MLVQLLLFGFFSFLTKFSLFFCLFREPKAHEIIDIQLASETAAQTSFPITPEVSNHIEKIEKTGSGEQEGEGYSGSEDSDSNRNETHGVKIPMERRTYYESTEKYRKTLRLSSEQIVRYFVSRCYRYISMYSNLNSD